MIISKLRLYNSKSKTSYSDYQVIEVELTPLEFTIMMAGKFDVNSINTYIPVAGSLTRKLKENGIVSDNSKSYTELSKYSYMTYKNITEPTYHLSFSYSCSAYTNKLAFAVVTSKAYFIDVYDENGSIILELNSKLNTTEELGEGSKTLTVCVLDLNRDSVSNFSPVIHNYSLQSHDEILELALTEKQYDAIIHREVFSDGVDTRNNIKLYDTLTQSQSDIDLMRNNMILDFDINKSYSPTSNYLGSRYCIFLDKLYKAIQSVTGELPIKVSECIFNGVDYTDYYQELLENLNYSSLNTGGLSYWIPVSKVDYVPIYSIGNLFECGFEHFIQSYNPYKAYNKNDYVIYPGLKWTTNYMYKSLIDNNKKNSPINSEYWIKLI